MKAFWLILAATLGLNAQNCTVVGTPFSILNGLVQSGPNVQCPAPSVPTTTAPYADPKTVLVVEQGNGGPETGTGALSASHFVASHYMGVRGIPASNLLTIYSWIEDGWGASCVPMSITSPDGLPPHDAGAPIACNYTHSASTNISQTLYQSEIATPILNKIKALAAAGIKIKYVVPTYGVPYMIMVSGVSVDSSIAGLVSGSSTNTYYSTFDSAPAHIDTSTTTTLLVARLDGPSAVLSAGLVDKAIKGEAGVGGVAYFDYNPAAQLGGTSLNAYNVCLSLNISGCTLNTQSQTNPEIQSAPNTSFCWGGYDLSAANYGAYTFVPGAVCAQMNSNAANCLRANACSGGYAQRFLAAGVTATWGPTNEPYTSGYATGDSIISHLCRGYTYGESAYIATPSLFWMMVFVGDPLYRPRCT